MSKLVHLLVAGAVITGGATATTVALSPASPAFACSTGSHSTPETRYADSLPTLRVGSSGAAVLGLQDYLRNHEGRTYLQGTGTFGPKTRQAVRHFEATHHLPINGVVTSRVWRQIITTEYHLPGAVRNPQLNPGASMNSRSGGDVGNMAVRMNGLPWFAWNSAGSHYNGKLLASVKEFQKRVGLQGTGVFGAKTTKAMVTVISIAGQWGC